MNFYAAVVADEAKVPELVHEIAHARACCADHLRQRFLTEFSHDVDRRAHMLNELAVKDMLSKNGVSPGARKLDLRDLGALRILPGNGSVLLDENLDLLSKRSRGRCRLESK